MIICGIFVGDSNCNNSHCEVRPPSKSHGDDILDADDYIWFITDTAESHGGGAESHDAVITVPFDWGEERRKAAW